jgi:hypothetical protein
VWFLRVFSITLCAVAMSFLSSTPIMLFLVSDDFITNGLPTHYPICKIHLSISTKSSQVPFFCFLMRVTIIILFYMVHKNGKNVATYFMCPCNQEKSTYMKQTLLMRHIVEMINCITCNIGTNLRNNTKK